MLRHFAILLLFAVPAAAADVTVVDQPPVAPANSQYVSNRKPLQPSGLVPQGVGGKNLGRRLGCWWGDR